MFTYHHTRIKPYTVSLTYIYLRMLPLCRVNAGVNAGGVIHILR